MLLSSFKVNIKSRVDCRFFLNGICQLYSRKCDCICESYEDKEGRYVNKEDKEIGS